MAGLHEAYPDDVEGSAFYALSLLADVAPDDTSLTKERKALSVLVLLFHSHPEHPVLAQLHHSGMRYAVRWRRKDLRRYPWCTRRFVPSSPHALQYAGTHLSVANNVA